MSVSPLCPYIIERERECVCVLVCTVPATPPRTQGKRVGWGFLLETVFIVSREKAGWSG